MSDLIDRQDAIDALGDEPEVWTGKDEYAQGLNNQWHYDRNAILSCPSAEPDVPDTNVGDCISRQAVLDLINADWKYEGLEIKINNLPSAQPVIRCKDCRYYKTYQYVNGRPKFLPKCGFNDIYVTEEDFCSRAERRQDG